MIPSWSPEALQDLDRIVAHMLGEATDGPAIEAASRTLQRIVAAVDGLVKFPLIGRPVAFGRRLVVDAYCVVYWVDREPLRIEVLRVRHGKEVPYGFEAED
jgi:plasmid stabilization system protein ParE